MFEEIVALVPETGRVTYAEFHQSVLTAGLANKLAVSFNTIRKGPLQLVNERDPETGALITYVQRRVAEGQV